MRDTAKFWDRRAPGYAKRSIKNTDAYRETVERTKSYLKGDAQVLEVGCGTGSTALLIAPAVERITATDISSKMLEIAREKAMDQGIGNIDFVQATLSDGALPNGPYDAVIAFNFLHLLVDLPGALNQISELLRPGGVFISKTVCLAEKMRMWRLFITVIRALGLAPHVNFLKIWELEELIVNAGFEIVEAGAFQPSPPSRFIVARKV